jgi:BirA family transcriptional regulator, biotin operon repressor / biotin---[acetyl-CoA-carboxylase] ligase
MDEARSLAASLPSGRIWIISDIQTGGRGRQGRQWQSPAGNLHVTLLLPAPCELKHQPKLGFVAGVALCNAVRSFLPDPDAVKLKWPNDIVYQGAKLSGLLLEGLEQGRMISIGMGVNIVAGPKDTPYPATFLNVHGTSITAAQLFERLAVTLSEELQSFADGSGFERIRERWLKLAAHLNQRISVRNGGYGLEGVFQNIDADGQLVLETASETKLIAAGDVFPLDK